MKSIVTSEIINNPFVKAKNRTWQLNEPATLTKRVSPPPAAKRQKSSYVEDRKFNPRSSSVEAGKAQVEDHVSFFAEKLLAARRHPTQKWPRITHHHWLELYQRNVHSGGHHFVIHQHDHPVAGTHYDLRLQCNATSSISFAIMYGLPGDPNSRRLNRNATETRVHNLWNHLIETASYQTGTMLIWDTGEYEVLPWRLDPSQNATDDEAEDPSSSKPGNESDRLHEAFQHRRIRLRLHGTKLPQGYTLSLRLTHDNDHKEQPKRPSRKRKRQDPKAVTVDTTSSDTDSTNPMSSAASLKRQKSDITSYARTASPPSKPKYDINNDAGGSDPEEDHDEETIRLTNTYPGGAHNSIHSVHQRKWYLSLDRRASGFVPDRKKVYGNRIWVRQRKDATATKGPMGFEKFHVMGRDVERSVVTGRLARDVLEDEGVEGYVPRGLWMPATN